MNREVNPLWFLFWFCFIVALYLASSRAHAQTDLDSPTSGDLLVPDHVQTMVDRFGIREIYPSGGRSWYVNMANAGFLNDGGADPDWYYSTAANNQPVLLTSGPAAGAWQSSDMVPQSFSGTRIQIGTTIPEANWNNVEITEYVYLESAVMDAGSDFTMDLFTHSGGQHMGNGSPPDCPSGAYHNEITYVGGSKGGQKEVYHTGGYTATHRGVISNGTIPDLQGRWIGMKAMVYGFAAGTGVIGEVWYDTGLLQNNWTQMTTWADDGGWGGGTSGFCGYNDPAVSDLLLGGYAFTAFRADNAVWDWKYLSIREISPPLP